MVQGGLCIETLGRGSFPVYTPGCPGLGSVQSISRKDEAKISMKSRFQYSGFFFHCKFTREQSLNACKLSMAKDVQKHFLYLGHLKLAPCMSMHTFKPQLARDWCRCKYEELQVHNLSVCNVSLYSLKKNITLTKLTNFITSL